MSSSELEILQKGISFVPSARFDLFTWIKDVNLFIRKLKWKKFFAVNNHKRSLELGLCPEDMERIDTLVSIMDEEDHDPSHGPFTSCRAKSTKMPPPGNDEVLDTFLFMVTDSLEKRNTSDTLKNLSEINHNLSRDQLLALKNLETDSSIVIKSADKGGNLVIMDHTQYRDMCMSILSDKRGTSSLGTQRIFFSLNSVIYFGSVLKIT